MPDAVDPNEQRKAAARVRLSRMIAASTRPVVSPEEVDVLLDQFRTTDDDGRLVSDPDWHATWALNRAAAEGWRWKAAAVAADFNFSADDASYSKGDVMAKCLEMANKYAAMGVGTMGVVDEYAAAPYDSPRLLL